VAICRHIDAFRMSTYEVLRSLFFGEASMDAVRHRLGTLRRRGHVQAQDFFPKPGESASQRRVYFHLTPLAARTVSDLDGYPLDASGRSARPLSAEALARHYAMLLYCAADPASRVKLSPARFTRNMGVYAENRLHANAYYLERACLSDDGEQRIGFIQLIRNPRRAEKLYLSTIQKRALLPGWSAEGFMRQRFFIAFVTLNDLMRARVEEELARRPRPVPYRVEAFDDLQGAHHAARARGSHARN
jgi:hypothetical protein